MKNISYFILVFSLMSLVAGCGKNSDAPKAPDADPVAVAATNFELSVSSALDHLAKGEVAKADAAVKSAIANSPDSAEARLIDGQVAYLKNDYARAMSSFESVAHESSLPEALRSDAFVSCGVVEMARNQNDLARIAFLRAMRLNRRNAAAWYHLGILSRDVYKFREAALEQFEMSARFSDPRDARTKKLSRDIIPALRSALQKAAATRPGVEKRDPAASAKLYAEGEKLQAKKSIRMAIKKYEAAFEADVMNDTAAAKFAYLLALNDKKTSAVDRALEAYAAASDQRPQRQAYYLSAARLAYANSRWGKSAEIMSRAIAHDPENRQSLDLLIASLLKEKKVKQAEAWKSYRSEIK